jgi:NADPH-dependent 2,4-dienoyl-CoA reductase/sulfur reductase-like enzyme
MAANKISTVPHSWPLNEWPVDVYPCRASKGKYTVRAHRDELIACGAIVRVGRDIVVIGGPYAAWLAKKGNRVSGFEIAPNRRDGLASVAAA